MADVLIVEDDPAIVKGLELNLRFEQHRVRSVSTGDEAMQQIAASRPDLLILDVMLPGADGFAVCRQIRARDSELPILFLTARGEEADRIRGLDLGADDYLTKPFSLGEFLARVRSLLRRSGSGRPTASSLPAEAAFGDVRLDFKGHVAHRNGEEVHLTVKEFALIRLLIAHPGEALERGAILSRVWGDDVNVTNRTVDTHVLSLRQKLEPEPSSPRYIVTVHGVGYRFVDVAVKCSPRVP